MPNDISNQQRDWFQLIALSGEPGKRWVAEYKTPQRIQLMNGALEAIGLLREFRIEQGRQVLLNLAGLVPTRKLTSSFSSILRRHYLPVLAFYHYRIEEFLQAEKLLDQAQEEVRNALQRRTFLLPFVDSCLDFEFQRARIARNQKRWHVMRDRLRRVQAMMEGREPFCILEDGTSVNMSMLRTFYDSIPLSGREQPWLINLLDPIVCSNTFRQISAEIYAATSPVILF